MKKEAKTEATVDRKCALCRKPYKEGEDTMICHSGKIKAPWELEPLFATFLFSGFKGFAVHRECLLICFAYFRRLTNEETEPSRQALREMALESGNPDIFPDIFMDELEKV